MSWKGAEDRKPKLRCLHHTLLHTFPLFKGPSRHLLPKTPLVFSVGRQKIAGSTGHNSIEVLWAVSEAQSKPCSYVRVPVLMALHLSSEHLAGSSLWQGQGCTLRQETNTTHVGTTNTFILPSGFMHQMLYQATVITDTLGKCCGVPKTHFHYVIKTRSLWSLL